MDRNQKDLQWMISLELWLFGVLNFYFGLNSFRVTIVTNDTVRKKGDGEVSGVIRISDKLLLKDIKKYAKVESRTEALQLTYWAKIGKMALDNPDLPAGFIKDILMAREDKSEATPFEFRV